METFMSQIIFEYGLMADIDDTAILDLLSDMALSACEKAHLFSNDVYDSDDFTALTQDDFHVTLLRNSVLQKILDGYEILPEVRNKTLEKLNNEILPGIVLNNKIGYVSVEKKSEIKASLFVGLDNQDEWRSYMLKCLECLKLSLTFNAHSLDQKIINSIEDFHNFISSISDETPYFHISLANISKGNPYKSVGNVSRKVARQNSLI